MRTIKSHQLYTEQVRQLYSVESVGMIATIVNSALLVFLHRHIIPHRILMAWFLSLASITFLRYLSLRVYQRTPDADAQSRKWGTLFIIGLVASGTIWGSAALLMFAEGSIPHQVFLGFVLGGMVAGATGAFSVVMGAFLAYSIPALTPIAYRCFSMGDDLHMAMGTMIVLFGVLMFITALRINRMTLTSFKLRFENQDLIGYLADAKEQAETINQRLKLEIVERQKAEEELKRHREHLESMVEERTSELVTINDRLAREIEVRKTAEEALRENEKRYRELADLLPQPVIEMDMSGHLSFANRALFAFSGYAPEDIEKGLNVYQMLVPDDRERAREITQRLAVGEEIKHVEYMAQRKDGSIFPVITYASPILRADRLVGFRMIVVDITERKKIEEDLLKTQKLESLGVLAGGLAHDFNNILTAIIGNVSLAKMYAKPGDEITKRLTETEIACFRAKHITQRLLTFARGGDPIKKVLPLADIIRESTSFALRGSNVKCLFSITDDLWPSEVDEGQLNQVLSNLIINSKQAMPGGGVVRVTAENLMMQKDSSPTYRTGRYVRIVIEDQGTGIAQEHLPKIFDPYFTTKQTGSGLGLATVYSIVRSHGGHITVESKLGNGTAFSVYLPASEREVAPGVVTEVKIHAGKGRILVMDDERMVCDIAGNILSHFGYQVAFAEDGNQALELYRNAGEAGEPFAAVIMDLTIPGGMGGKEAIQKLLDLDPQAKVIVSSGYSNDPILARFHEYGFKGVVAKPYKMEDLNKTLHEVLGNDQHDG